MHDAVMRELLTELTALGEVARATTLRARGIREADLYAAVASGVVTRPRRGWVASPLADFDQLRAIAVGGRIGCISALRRFGVWSGVDDELHVHVPRTASRLEASPDVRAVATAGVWHPTVPERKRRSRAVLLAKGVEPHVHWARELASARALDWIVSPPTALAVALRCLDREHGSAAIDSVLHERVLTRREVAAVLATLPNAAASLVDRFTGHPESGAESIFIRRMTERGFHIEPQVQFAGFGRFDGLIDGCVLFEVDGRGFHSGVSEFFTDRDRSLAGQAFGVPVVRPSATHVLDDWEATVAAVARVVEDAKVVRRYRGLPPVA
jgi:hypothetical protein